MTVRAQWKSPARWMGLAHSLQSARREAPNFNWKTRLRAWLFGTRKVKARSAFQPKFQQPCPGSLAATIAVRALLGRDFWSVNCECPSTDDGDAESPR